MKKFFLFLLTVAIPAAVMASADKDAVSKTIVNFFLERGSMNISKVLEYCTPEFTEGPGEVNYRTLQTLARHTDTVLKSNDWVAVCESASWIFLGRQPDEATRAEAGRIKNTPAAQEKIAAVRKEFDALRKKSSKGIGKITFADITVSGNSAKAEFEGIRNIDTAYLKKINGKWLISATERTDWKRKAEEKKRAAEKAVNEKAVQDAITGHRKAVLMLDLKQALSFCDRSCQEYGSDGKKLLYDDLEKLAGYAYTMEKSDDLTAVMESALAMQGKKLSDAQRKKTAAIAKSKEADEAIAMVRANFQKIRQDGKKAAAGLKVIRITFPSAASAAADMTITDPDSKKAWLYRYSLVKKGNKWLINKVETTNLK